MSAKIHKSAPGEFIIRVWKGEHAEYIASREPADALRIASEIYEQGFFAELLIATVIAEGTESELGKLVDVLSGEE